MDIEIKVADSFFSKLRGLMFRRKVDYGLLFILNKETRSKSSIHSFFVFFKFDAVFMGKEGKVIDIKRKIKPFNPLIVPKKPCKYILELPNGKADELEIEEGNKLSDLIENKQP